MKQRSARLRLNLVTLSAKASQNQLNLEQRKGQFKWQMIEAAEKERQRVLERETTEYTKKAERESKR